LAHVCGCASVRLDAGDEMQGTLLSNSTFGRGTIDALNALGIDAAAIGNHEFDWSLDTLRARMSQAKYPFLSANITNAAGTARPDWATPWKLVTKSGVKIAVIGLTTTETPTSTASRNIQGLAIVEAQSSGRSVGIVDFVRTGGRREMRVQLVTPYADQVKPDVALTDALGHQQQAVRNLTERVVARLKIPLKRAGDEYGLGRLIA